MTLTDNDISIITTAATASVVEAATTTYDVTLGEAPPAATTVGWRVKPGTATVSPATLSFTTTNWNSGRSPYRCGRWHHHHPPYRAHRRRLQVTNDVAM